METHSPGTGYQQLWTALERNAEWIKRFIAVTGRPSVVDEYLRWFFERLKDRVPPEVTDEVLDKMIRSEVGSIYGKFRDRLKAGLPFTADIVDPAARRFESVLEDGDELRAALECVPDEARDLILRVFSETEDDLSKGRDRLARRLGLTRNALDQRLSRAYRRIRERMNGRRGSHKP